MHVHIGKLKEVPTYIKTPCKIVVSMLLFLVTVLGLITFYYKIVFFFSEIWYICLGSLDGLAFMLT